MSGGDLVIAHRRAPLWLVGPIRRMFAEAGLSVQSSRPHRFSLHRDLLASGPQHGWDSLYAELDGWKARHPRAARRWERRS